MVACSAVPAFANRYPTAFLFPHRCEQPFEILQLGNVALHAHGAVTYLLDSRCEFLTPPPCYKDLGPSVASSLAVANPIPLVPPVTTAILFSTLPGTFTLLRADDLSARFQRFGWTADEIPTEALEMQI